MKKFLQVKESSSEPSALRQVQKNSFEIEIFYRKNIPQFFIVKRKLLTFSLKLSNNFEKNTKQTNKIFFIEDNFQFEIKQK